MKKGFKFAVMVLLFLTGTGGAIAGPFSRAFQGRGERQHREAQQDERQQPQADARRVQPGSPVAPGGPATPAASGTPGAALAQGEGSGFNRPPEQNRRMGGR